jgi:hypothetical protein
MNHALRRPQAEKSTVSLTDSSRDSSESQYKSHSSQHERSSQSDGFTPQLEEPADSSQDERSSQVELARFSTQQEQPADSSQNEYTIQPDGPGFTPSVSSSHYASGSDDESELEGYSYACSTESLPATESEPD